MRNIWLLLKNYFLCGVGSFRQKNTRSKSVIGISFIVLAFVAFFAFFTWMMLEIAKDMSGENLQASVLTLGLIISIFFAVIFALQKITGGKKANDTELLLSMPIKKIEIMIAKALSRLGFNLLIVTMFFLPCIIAYWVYTPFNLVAFIGCITILVLIPLFAVGLSYLIDYLVAICFTNSKFGNISKAIFTLITLFGAVVIYEFVIYNIASPYMIKVVNWMLTFNPAVMIPLISGVILIFILGNWLNALLLNHENRESKKKTIKISSKVTSPFLSLLKNESNRYFNSPTLMLNTLLGPLLMIGLTIWLVVDHGQTLTTQLHIIFGATDGISVLLIGLVFAGLTILTYPSAFSISLEGKQLWILRSMPIPAHTILNAKVLFSVLLISPVSLVCTLIIDFMLNLSFLNSLVIVLIPILTNIFISYTGVLINLCFPKFEFESEATVIKQSMSSFIMMFGGLITVACLLGLSIWLTQVLSLLLVNLIIIGTLVIANGITITLTYTLGQRMFNHL